MKVLLDESIDVEFRHEVVGHDVYTVTYMRWNGLKNGALLAQAAEHGFDALVTTDRNIPHQQNVGALPCAVVIIMARSNDLADLKVLVPNLLGALSKLTPRSVVHVRT